MRWFGPLLAGALLGAVVGAGAMWIVSASDASRLDADFSASAKSGSSGERGESNVARENAAPELAPAAAAADPTAPERSAGDVRESLAPMSVLDSVSRAVRHAPASSDVKGTKTIKGSVTDLHGKELAGVLVRATRQGDDVPAKPWKNDQGKGAPPPPTLEETVRKAVEQYYEQGSEYKEVATGPDGKFLLADLRPGRWHVGAWQQGFVFDSNNGRSGSDVRPDATIDFVAKPVFSVPVEVTLPDGKKAATALLSIRKQGDTNDRQTQGWFAKEPTLAVEAGDWEAKASLGDPHQGPAWPEMLASEYAKFSVTADTPASPVKLELKGKPGIRGHVQKEDGTVLQYANVRLKKIDSGEPDLKALAKDEDVQTNWSENGEFAFNDLKPGRYVVGACREWNSAVVAHAVVVVESGTVNQDLVIPALDVAACVVVKVRGPDNELVPTVNFNWMLEKDKNTNWSNGSWAERKEPGTWWIPLESANQGDFDVTKAWPIGSRLFLYVYNELYGNTSVEVFQNTRNLDVQFGPPAILYVTVAGYVGGAYEGRIQVQCGRTGDNAQRRWGGGGGQPSKDDGRVKIGPMEAGRYKVTLFVNDKGQRWNQTEVASTELSLTSGENQATMSIPPLYPLTVRMPDGSEPNVQVQLQSLAKQAQRWRWGQVGKDATVTFGDLPPGDYRVTVNGGSSPGIMNVSVPAGGTVNFVPMTVNAMRVLITDGNGQLAVAGFQNGDLVVQLEGKEITSVVDWQVLQQAARVKKQAKFTVERGGEKVELTLETKYLNDGGKLGGSFDPTAR
jgi:hypothetical protein